MVRSPVAVLVVVVAAAAMTPVANATFVQEDGSPYDVGADPYSVAVADFTSDGRPDMVAVSGTASKATMFKRLAPRGFEQEGAPIDLNPGFCCAGPNFNAVADFNGDTRPDVAIANYQSSDISMLTRKSTNDGFTQTRAATGGGTGGVGAADFNADGLVDLAAADYDNSKAVLLLQNSIGPFGFTAEPGPALLTGGNARYVVVADFNKDGRPDIAVPNDKTPGSVAVFLRKPTNDGFDAMQGSPFPVGESRSTRRRRTSTPMRSPIWP